MGNRAISVSGLEKRYQIGVSNAPYGRLTESMWGALRAPLDLLSGKRRERGEWIWALRDVSFGVDEGEVVGLIGSNGAGKTTLLKVLSRITEPTGGTVMMRGRVGALLEVGTGFHPELTGRENIYMSSAMYGMKRAEIQRKFDQIVDFAGGGIDRFLETPVKRYSSGMQLRLGFAVAAHLDPEILIVDEVLAVGDAAFQKKCLGKMGEVARDGRTVLLVSHNMAAVQTLSPRAIWIDHGRIMEDGPSGTVIAHYLNVHGRVSAERVWSDISTAPGNDRARLRRASARPVGGMPNDPIGLDTAVLVEFDYWNLVPDSRLDVVLELYNGAHVLVLHTASFKGMALPGHQPIGLYRSVCQIPANLLNADAYGITLKLIRDGAHADLTLEDAVVFDVSEDTDRETYYQWLGAVRPNLIWSTELLTTPINRGAPQGV